MDSFPRSLNKKLKKKEYFGEGRIFWGVKNKKYLVWSTSVKMSLTKIALIEKKKTTLRWRCQRIPKWPYLGAFCTCLPAFRNGST